MNIAEPTWIAEGSSRLVDLIYQLRAVSMGTHQLTNIKIGDNSTTAFSNAGALIKTVTIRSDNSLKVNATYTGRGTDTTLIDGGDLPVGGQAQVWIRVRLDVSQASTLIFSKNAIIYAVDATGSLCQDYSTDGMNVDPDTNGNPVDNNEPARVTLQLLRPQEDETVLFWKDFRRMVMV